MSQFFDTWQTPLGAFAVAVNGAGAVVATAFGGGAELSRMRGVGELTPAPGRARAARAQIEQYFAGERECFDLPLAANGTPFSCEYGTLSRQSRTAKRAPTAGWRSRLVPVPAPSVALTLRTPSPSSSPATA
jgi:hypothetical protein